MGDIRDDAAVTELYQHIGAAVPTVSFHRKMESRRWIPDQVGDDNKTAATDRPTITGEPIHDQRSHYS